MWFLCVLVLSVLSVIGDATAQSLPASVGGFYRNKSGSMVPFGTAVELDTAWVQLTNQPGKALGIPDTLPVDSLGRVDTNSVGLNRNPNARPPFRLIFVYIGTISTDTFWVHGLVTPPAQLGQGTGGAEVVRERIVPAGKHQRSVHTWVRLDSVACPTTDLDSIRLVMVPLLSFAVADSLDPDYLGQVGQDSIPADSLGFVITFGPAPALIMVDSLKRQIFTGDWLITAAGGKLVRASGAHADTFQVGRALNYSKAAVVTSDTLLVDLKVRDHR